MGAESELERPAGSAPSAPRTRVFGTRIRSHKIIQWGLGYLGAALALAQAQELVANAFDWPSAVGRLFVVALIGGLPIALTLAWYHGHRGLQRVSAGELMILSALFLIAALFFTIALRPSSAPTTATAATPAQSPADQAAAPAASGGSAAEAPPANSIAVLPFLNISSDPEQEFFADGLSEELMNQLAQISELRVTARTSSFAFKGRTENVSSIGEQLKVAHVLEGSVRKAGDRVLITAQLIETANGFHLWSNSFNRGLDDIFAVQEEISREVASALKVTLGIDQDLRTVGGTRNIEAYQLYLETTQRTGRGQVFRVADEQLALARSGARARSQLRARVGAQIRAHAVSAPRRRTRRDATAGYGRASRAARRRARAELRDRARLARSRHELARSMVAGRGRVSKRPEPRRARHARHRLWPAEARRRALEGGTTTS